LGATLKVVKEYTPDELHGWQEFWDEPNVSTVPLTTACDIDRRSTLSEDEFISKYVAKGRPVLMKGLIDRWPARVKWVRKYLLSTYGNETVRVSNSSDVGFTPWSSAPSSGTFYDKSQESQLKDFLQKNSYQNK